MRKRVALIALVAMQPFLVGVPSSFAAEQQSEATAREKLDRTFSLPSDKRHTLWIPSDYQVRGNKIDVLIDFHGAPGIVRRSVRLAKLNCVVISVTYAGLSSVYRVPFSDDRRRFATLLDEALDVIQTEKNSADDVVWGRMAISSFSAGFGAVRELLKSQEYFDRIDGICLVDSLYCGYVGDGTSKVQEGVVHPGLMKDFLRFAREGADGRKVMIVTHCCGPTPGYASTRETADYLLGKLNLTAELVDIAVELPNQTEVVSAKLRIYRQAKRKGFSLYGTPGSNETDHVEHLRQMAYWLPNLPLEKSN